VFIHFTKEGQATENKQWAFHVAPYVLVNGEEYVLDGGFGVFNHKPVKLSDWMKYFGKSDRCVVLDPVHDQDHLLLETNNLYPRQYPATEGTCYVRKVPMYYLSPVVVDKADHALAGDAQCSDFVQDHFEPIDVLSSCKRAMSMGAQLKTSCSDYLGIHNPEKEKVSRSACTGK
jgi:hypothetical protein